MFYGCKEKNAEMPSWMKGFEKFNAVVNGKKEGKHFSFDDAGNVLDISFYTNDSLCGESLNFYPTGKLKSKMIFRGNKVNGAAYYFYPSGVIESIREWEDDKKVGYGLDFYDTTGETKASLLYNEDGFLIERKTYSREGNLINKEISKTYQKQLDSMKRVNK
jgi:antitoxin component YwqK of YwqJK toxin-antitoxin module